MLLYHSQRIYLQKLPAEIHPPGAIIYLNISRLLVIRAHDNHTVPAVLAIRLLIRALPLDRDPIRSDAVFLDQLLSDRSRTLLRQAHVVRRSTRLLIRITNYLDRRIVLLHELCRIVNVDVLVLVDLSAIDAEEYHIVYVVINHRSNRFRTLRTRYRTFAQLVILRTQRVDLAIQVVQLIVIHRLHYLEVGLAQLESQTGAQLHDTIRQVVHIHAVELLVQQRSLNLHVQIHTLAQAESR